ncbi:kielin/chordin-like protein, partial [Elysia marginata]
MTCSKRTCSEDVSCRDPGRDECGCPSCDGCEFLGQKVANQRTVPDPRDSCADCTCERGTMTCSKRTCSDDVSCRDPGRDECGCPSCDGCEFLGQTVANQKTVPDPRNSCSECTCL